MLAHTYYAQNYAGIIYLPLHTSTHKARKRGYIGFNLWIEIAESTLAPTKIIIHVHPEPYTYA